MSLYTIRTSEGVQIGPISKEQVDHLIRQCRIKPSTMIFTTASNRWHLAASLPEIRVLLLQCQPVQAINIQRIHQQESAGQNSASKIARRNKSLEKIESPSKMMAKAPSTGPELYNVRASDGVEYGPMTIEQMRDLVKEGRVRATTMVFTRSSGRWHLAASLQEVRALLRKYAQGQTSVLNRIRAVSDNPRDSAHVIPGSRTSTIRVKNPFWKRLFRKA